MGELTRRMKRSTWERRAREIIRETNPTFNWGVVELQDWDLAWAVGQSPRAFAAEIMNCDFEDLVDPEPDHDDTVVRYDGCTFTDEWWLKAIRLIAANDPDFNLASVTEETLDFAHQARQTPREFVAGLLDCQPDELLDSDQGNAGCVLM